MNSEKCNGENNGEKSVKSVKTKKITPLFLRLINGGRV